MARRADPGWQFGVLLDATRSARAGMTLFRSRFDERHLPAWIEERS